MQQGTDRIGLQFGDYRLRQLLGSGGFAEVYLAEQVSDGRLVALKLLQTQLKSQQELKEFLNEARTFRLNHPNIVRLLDFGLGADDAPYLVMEYAPFGTLRDRHPRGTRLSLAEVLAYIQPIGSALQYAHERQLVHRDIKPENMLIGPQQQIWLSDFGIASIAHSSTSMQAERAVGTWPYMAPEQIQGKPRPASDQYALGIVVYEWLCGLRPFRGTMAEIIAQHLHSDPPSLRTQVPDLPIEVEKVIFTALEKYARHRFASMQEFVSAFQQASQLAGEGGVTVPVAQGGLQPLNAGGVAGQGGLPHSQYGQSEQTILIEKTSEQRSRISRRLLIGGLAGLVVVGASSTAFFWLSSSSNKELGQRPASSATHPPVPTTATSSPAAKSDPTPTALPIGTTIFTYQQHKDYVYSVRWSSNDNRIVSASEDRTVQIWDTLNGRHILLYMGHKDRANEAVWSPDNSMIASASSDETVQVWKAANGAPVFSYRGHQAAIFTVNWSPQANRIASGGLDTQVHVWDALAGGNVIIYRGHTNIVNKLSFSPDGKRIASGGNDTTVRVWDQSNGATAYVYRGHTAGVRMANWSPDGMMIASASDDQTVQVWDAKSGTAIFTYRGHHAPVSSAVWSPDGKRIASSSEDGTVQVWDAFDGMHPYSYQAQEGRVFDVAWSHNGLYLASSGDRQNPIVRIWSA